MNGSLWTVTFDQKIKVIIPSIVVHKLRYLADKIRQSEWSGVLLYKTIGDFNKRKFHIEIVDIYLMAEGSSVYVEYETSTDFIEFLMTNPENRDYNQGLIHSHNTMSTFFSSTDMDELQVNSKYHNYYLSLIVNNYLDATAKIAFCGKITNKKSIFSYRGENGELIQYTCPNTEEEDVLFVYDCIIELEDQLNMTKQFQERVTLIQEKAKRSKSANNDVQHKIDQYYNTLDENYNELFDEA